MNDSYISTEDESYRTRLLSELGFYQSLAVDLYNTLRGSRINNEWSPLLARAQKFLDSSTIKSRLKYLAEESTDTEEVLKGTLTVDAKVDMASKSAQVRVARIENGWLIKFGDQYYAKNKEEAVNTLLSWFMSVNRKIEELGNLRRENG